MSKIIKTSENLIEKIDQRLNKLTKRRTEREVGGKGFINKLKTMKKDNDIRK